MRTSFALAVGMAVFLLVSSLALGAAVSPAASYPPLKGTITGPTLLAVGAKATFTLTASGGPAAPTSGTLTGNYTYNASLSGGNTSGGSVTPTSGSLVKELASLTVTAPNNTGSYILTVELKSSPPRTGNSTYTNVTYPFNVVVPYVVTATLVNPTEYAIKGAVIAVSLDGTNVNDITISTIGANGTYNFAYNYTTSGLSSGYHTFTLTIHSTPGLLEFLGPNGQRVSQLTTTFYVTPPAPDYTLYILTGISLTVLAIFISLLVVGGRARRRTKG